MEGKAGKARQVVKTYQFPEKGYCWTSRAFERIMLQLATSTKNHVPCNKKIKDQSTSKFTTATEDIKDSAERKADPIE